MSDGNPLDTLYEIEVSYPGWLGLSTIDDLIDHHCYVVDEETMSAIIVELKRLYATVQVTSKESGEEWNG